MTLPSNRKWLSLTVLAIIIPIGLLATFKLTGIIPEPPIITETITAETITWNMTRPEEATGFAGRIIENNYNVNGTNVRLSIHITSYLENEEQFGDCLWFSVNATATVQQGFIYSVNIRFSQTDENAFLLVSKQTEWIKLENLKITSLSTEATYSSEAHLYTTGVNNPKTCTLENPVFWYFLDINENNLDHWATITLETTYFNGTAYRKVTMPLQIGVLTS
jgi:hypothetical protein